MWRVSLSWICLFFSGSAVHIIQIGVAQFFLKPFNSISKQPAPPKPMIEHIAQAVRRMLQQRQALASEADELGVTPLMFAAAGGLEKESFKNKT